MNLFELFIKIGVDDNNAKKTLSSVEKATQSVGNAFRSVQKPTGQLSTSMKGVSSATDGMAKEIKNATKDMDGLSDEAQDLAKGMDDVKDGTRSATSEIRGLGNSATKTSLDIGEIGSAFGSVGNIVGNVLGVALKAVTVSFEIATAAAGAFVATVSTLTVASVKGYSEFEQLSGGASKIFDELRQSDILKDAQRAFLDLNISANEYLAVINDVGAAFASTMGDKDGYETARKGLLAIADYASGTGKNVDELSAKFTLITRSTSSYQSIADQFSGILPATSAAFLEQAKAAGLLRNEYEELTDIPIAEYQMAVAEMLRRGVSDLGLSGNAAQEAMTTISGSINATGAAWKNLITSFADENANLEELMDNFSKSAITALKLILPRVGLVLNGATFFVRDAFSVLFAQIPRIVSENIPILMQSSVALVEALAYGLVDNHDLILNAFVSAFSVLSGGVEKLLPALYVFARESTILFNEVIGEIAPDIAVSFVRGIVNGFSAAYAGENVNRFYESFGKLLSGLTQALVDSAPYFLSVGIEVATVFGQQALLNPEVLESLIKTGIEMIAIVARGFVKAIPIIGGAAMKAVANIASRFVNYDWAVLFLDIGGFVVSGLTEGIVEAWGDLEKQLNRLLDSLVDKAEKILGIASPSKVFKKMGSFTADGFGIGFEDEFAKVKDDMEDALNFDDASVGINASIRKVGAGAAGTAYGGTSIGNITINIDGAKYTDEQSLASAIALEIQNMTDRRAAVYA